MCPSHPRQHLNLFCRTDQTVICAQCFAVGSSAGLHAGHDIVELEKHLEDISGDLKAKLDDCQHHQGTLWSKWSMLQTAVKAIVRQGEAKKASLVEEESKLVVSLHHAVQTMCTSVDEQVKMCYEPLEQMQDQLELAISLESATSAKLAHVFEQYSVSGTDPEDLLRDVKQAVACYHSSKAETLVASEAPVPSELLVLRAPHTSLLGVVPDYRAGVQDAVRQAASSGLWLQALVTMLARVALQSSEEGAILRCFEAIGVYPLLYRDQFLIRPSYFLNPLSLPLSSQEPLLECAHSVLSSAAMLSDRTETGQGRVTGALYAVLVCTAATCAEHPDRARTVPEPWLRRGGVRLIGDVLRDHTQPVNVIELALSTLVSPVTHKPGAIVAPLVEAGFAHACISIMQRFGSKPSLRVAATKLLCSLCRFASAAMMPALIADGVAVALVEALQRTSDHHLIANAVAQALQQVSAIPEGLLALGCPAVRRAFNIAFQQRYPDSYNGTSSWHHADAIARLLYRGEDNDDLLLTHDTTVLIDACLNYIRAGWPAESTAGMIRVSAQILADLCCVPSYAEEAHRLRAVRVCLGAARACHRLFRADDLNHNGFCEILCALFSMLWRHDAARSQFIKLSGLPFLIEVLGDVSAGGKPSAVAARVCMVLFSLTLENKSAHALSALSSDAKSIIRKALSTHAAVFVFDWWIESQGSEILLRALAG